MNNNAHKKSGELFQASDLSSTAFVLKHLDVYNWGPFHGAGHAEIDSRGTAIIGPTGSGKTTLVDALMTLIVAQPKYNLASTGGHESDRDLISYVRGVTGAGNNTGDNSHIARPAKTVTGLAARFENHEQVIHIGALFWIDVGGNASSDLKKLWFFTDRDDQTLEHWLAIHHEGGKRALKQLERDTNGIRIHDSKKAYLAQLQRFFEVGKNAFPLLNRAAGLKQLNSVDEIFRELVLDDKSMFERAGEVANEFDDLANIHEELIIARKQQQSLKPILDTNREYQKNDHLLSEQQTLLKTIPVWFAMAGHRLWGERLEDLDQKLIQSNALIQKEEQQFETLGVHADTLQTIYLKAGGASIELLKGQIHQQELLTDIRRRDSNNYQTLARNLSLDDALTPEALSNNQQQVGEQREAWLQESEAQKLSVQELAYQLTVKEKQNSELKAEQETVLSRPGSNIQGKFQSFRSALADALNLDEDLLPFVAELVEVKTEESDWRGAIERAIGSHRERILVPPEKMQEALEWVNHRDNRLHVRLQEAHKSVKQPSFFNDGFTRKLNFKPHTYREALKSLLASVDRHCVDSPQVLKSTPHAMTAQGLMSGTAGRFEKQDQRRIDQNWMTGFDNQDRLASLNTQIQQTEKEKKQAKSLHQQARDKEKEIEAKLLLLKSLTEITFDSINLPEAEHKLDSLQNNLAALTAPDSDTEKARKELEQAKEAMKQLRHKINNLLTHHGELDNQKTQANKNCQQAFTRIGTGLTDDEMNIGSSVLPNPKQSELETLNSLERSFLGKLSEKIKNLQDKREKLNGRLVRLMGNAKSEDTGALSEAGTELQDIPQYLAQLQRLTEEALPEKQKRFLAYLNQSSDQGVTQLLTGIDDEVSLVEERIEDLNTTLKRVDFQPDQYLQLKPGRVQHESLRTLETARRHLRSAALKDDQGESHYQALVAMVQLLRQASENKRIQGSRALLDPRYRLQFSVEVRDRNNHNLLEIRTGSQGGSGGEKEIIASYILTASLSYALCPNGANQPLFGTIILDEAFSKSSQAVAGRIISALEEFGLHPLFVTPNKEMRLLRAHTRSAILVHRKGTRATLTSLSWEELEDHMVGKKSVSSDNSDEGKSS